MCNANGLNSSNTSHLQKCVWGGGDRKGFMTHNPELQSILLLVSVTQKRFALESKKPCSVMLYLVGERNAC